MIIVLWNIVGRRKAVERGREAFERGCETIG